MYHFAVLGPLVVRSRGLGVPLRAATTKRLLATLLCRPNRPVAVDELVEAVWEEGGPASPRKAVQLNVHRLRQLLGEDRIRYDSGTYQITVDTAELDTLRFADLTAEARGLVATGDLDRASARYEEALALRRGAPFSDVAAAGLVAQEAHRLAELLLVAEEERYAVHLDLGRAPRVVGELSALAAAHPYREYLRALLMLALYRAGRQVEALEVYRNTRAVLVEQLGVEPGAWLKALHEAILRSDGRLARIPAGSLGQLIGAATAGAATAGAAAAAAAVAAAAPANGLEHRATPVPRQLPGDITGFTDRAQLVAQLDAMLEQLGTSTGVVIPVLTGGAGVGKTALAVHWGHLRSDRFPGGQLYANLCGYSSSPPVPPEQVLAQFLRALGTPPERVPPAADEAAALYRSLLADRRVLVVLDNAASVEQVRPLLPGGRCCLALITSRDNLTGLVAREGARRFPVDVLTPHAAVALLANQVGADRVAAEPEAAAELASLCGLLPLALRIAAANIADRAEERLSSYVAELRQRGRLGALTVTGDREFAVRTAFHLSYRTVPPDAQRLFRLLGLTTCPDITPAGAAAMLGTSSEQAQALLTALSSVHLIDSCAPGRYSLGDLLRLYAREQATVTS